MMTNHTRVLALEHINYEEDVLLLRLLHIVVSGFYEAVFELIFALSGGDFAFKFVEGAEHGGGSGGVAGGWFYCLVFCFFLRFFKVGFSCEENKMSF